MTPAPDVTEMVAWLDAQADEAIREAENWVACEKRWVAGGNRTWAGISYAPVTHEWTKATMLRAIAARLKEDRG